MRSEDHLLRPFQSSKHLKQPSIRHANINLTKPDHCHQKHVQDNLSYISISYLWVSDVSTSAFKQLNILLFVEIDRFRCSYCCRLSFSSSESLLNYSDVRAPPVFMCWFRCVCLYWDWCFSQLMNKRFQQSYKILNIWLHLWRVSRWNDSQFTNVDIYYFLFIW